MTEPNLPFKNMVLDVITWNIIKKIHRKRTTTVQYLPAPRVVKGRLQ